MTPLPAKCNDSLVYHELAFQALIDLSQLISGVMTNPCQDLAKIDALHRSESGDR